MTPEEYEAKKQARIDRLEDAGSRAKHRGESLVSGARKMADVIPFGQPILVGHHSERGDRNYRGRIENKFRKGFEELDKSAYYERRAAAAANNTAIFSDDPTAAEKIEAKVARLEKRQDLMRAANKAIRKGDDEALRDLGFDDAAIAALKKGDFCGRVGYASYQLTNNSANIRRLKSRLTVVQAQAERVDAEYRIGAFRIVENTDINRVQLFFAKDLMPKVKEQLKHAAFKFSGQNVCWQRQWTYHAVYMAKAIAGSQRTRWEPESETVRSVPENYCLATHHENKWAVYRDEAATRRWHDAIEKVVGEYAHNEANMAEHIGAVLIEEVNQE